MKFNHFLFQRIGYIYVVYTNKIVNADVLYTMNEFLYMICAHGYIWCDILCMR